MWTNDGLGMGCRPMIEIWSPRYHDRRVLIAKYKVCDGNNDIVFTKAKHLRGKTFRVLGKEVKRCPIETNGVIECYAVPMEKLEQINEVVSTPN